MLALGETLNTPQLLRTTVLSPNNTYNRTIFLSLSLSLWRPPPPDEYR